MPKTVKIDEEQFRELVERLDRLERAAQRVAPPSVVPVPYPVPAPEPRPWDPQPWPPPPNRYYWENPVWVGRQDPNVTVAFDPHRLMSSDNTTGHAPV